MRGTIPPGGSVPLHSRGDPETFFIVSGDYEALVDGPGWTWLRAGDIFHVPGNA